MPANNSLGVDLMRRISEGQIKQLPTEYIEKVKIQITEACEEIIEIGARIRPLFASKKQIGWIRGLHPCERKMIDRWIYEKDDLVSYVLSMTTTFSREEIESLTSFEIQSLLTLVRKITEYDVSVYPYLAAYVTTMSSENLWHSKGRRLTSYENRVVTMPDGKQIHIAMPPDHARLWATLCTYREQAKKRLDESFNAVLTIRPLAGKNADPIAAELRNAARDMVTNAIEPWQKVIQVHKVADVNDGWGHPGDSIEDLKREMDAFIDGKDKHEQVMSALGKQMQDHAEDEQRRVSDIIRKRGGPGIVAETSTILTDAEVRQREKDLKKGRPIFKPTDREDREVTTMPHEKIQKYR